MNTEYKAFYPYGENEYQQQEKIISYLKEGWEVALVYGGNTPTVILRKLILK